MNDIEERQTFLDGLWKSLEEHQLDAVILSSPQETPSNIMYAANYYSQVFECDLPLGFFMVLIPNEEPILLGNSAASASIGKESWVKDARYYGPDEYQIRHGDHKEYALIDNPIAEAVRILKHTGADAGRVGLEMGAITQSIHGGIAEALPEAEFVDAGQVLSQLRSIKRPSEIERIKRATQITELAIQAIFDKAAVGVTTRALEQEILKVFAANNVYVGHLYIGAGAEESGDALHFGLDAPMQDGDILAFDFGCKFRGYHGDLARPAVVGTPSDKVIRLSEALTAAQQMAIEAVKPGITCGEIFNVAVQHVRDTGFPDYQRSHVGHGIGLALQELPFLVADSSFVLEPGMVFCVELPYYELGWGGFNIEDTVVVTEDGCDVLSTLDRSLRVL